MTEQAAAYFRQARKALRTARLALETDDADGCVNQAYYAAFYAASAALRIVGETPKTHKGTVNRFWVRFAQRTGRFSRSKDPLTAYVCCKMLTHQSSLCRTA